MNNAQAPIDLLARCYETAKAALQQDRGLSVREAAARYGVDRAVLANHLTKRELRNRPV